MSRARWGAAVLLSQDTEQLPRDGAHGHGGQAQEGHRGTRASLGAEYLHLQDTVFLDVRCGADQRLSPFLVSIGHVLSPEDDAAPVTLRASHVLSRIRKEVPRARPGAERSRTGQDEDSLKHRGCSHGAVAPSSTLR